MKTTTFLADYLRIKKKRNLVCFKVISSSHVTTIIVIIIRLLANRGCITTIKSSHKVIKIYFFLLKRSVTLPFTFRTLFLAHFVLYAFSVSFGKYVRLFRGIKNKVRKSVGALLFMKERRREGTPPNKVFSFTAGEFLYLQKGYELQLTH